MIDRRTILLAIGALGAAPGAVIAAGPGGIDPDAARNGLEAAARRLGPPKMR